MTETPQIVTDEAYHTIDHLLGIDHRTEDGDDCRYLRFKIGYTKGRGITLSVGEHMTRFHPEQTWNTVIYSLHSPRDAKIILEERKRRYRKNEDKLFKKLEALGWLEQSALEYGNRFPEKVSVTHLTDENDPGWAMLEEDRRIRTTELLTIAHKVAQDLNG